MEAAEDETTSNLDAGVDAAEDTTTLVTTSHPRKLYVQN